MLKQIAIITCFCANLLAQEYITPSGFSIIPEPQNITPLSGHSNKLDVISYSPLKDGKPESYILKITPQGTTISYADASGKFYAEQSLEQIKKQYKDQAAPCAIITDAPRYPWRGLLIDPPRHFYPVEDLKLFIRNMAKYKFNILHLRLNDDQGWRFPIPGYPKLISIASKREETSGNKTPHEGFYSKKDLKDIVAYAKQFHVEVVPEIDAPGHNQSLAAAYPELICFPNPDLKVRTTEGISKELVCPANPEVWKFYQAVFKELKEIFPSQSIHLGGDEAPTENWEKCPACKALRDKHKLATVHDEMTYFLTKINQLVKQNGKQGLFWFEETSPGYPEGSTVYTWRMGRTPSVIKLAREQKLKLICTPGEYAYLDYSYEQTPLKQVYEFDPSYNLPTDQQAHIQGVEATLWAERIPDMKKVFQMAYPRAYAIAEAGWSPMNVRSWKNFERKLPMMPKY